MLWNTNDELSQTTSVILMQLAERRAAPPSSAMATTDAQDKCRVHYLGIGAKDLRSLGEVEISRLGVEGELHAVYELYGPNGDVRYIGRVATAEAARKMLLENADRFTVDRFKIEQFNTEAEAKQRENDLMEQHKAVYGKPPFYN